ncbi:unnamed protein product [Paramecium sonneborni]|uniref:ADP-ribosylation factor n=1 Tax=Paramecium sonneborni TaxID=65129 RepID=A0A8S1PZ36_9CILI|nr:unnamed protein product [Paramecium sonneborni]
MGNLFQKYQISQKLQIIMIGLDAAGKTTILNQLKLGKVENITHTIGFNLKKLKSKELDIVCWDIGGSDKMRLLWKHYYQITKGLILCCGYYGLRKNDRGQIMVIKTID